MKDEKGFLDNVALITGMFVATVNRFATAAERFTFAAERYVDILETEKRLKHGVEWEFYDVSNHSSTTEQPTVSGESSG